MGVSVDKDVCGRRDSVLTRQTVKWLTVNTAEPTAVDTVQHKRHVREVASLLSPSAYLRFKRQSDGTIL
jgi:hypothetical protein